MKIICKDTKEKFDFGLLNNRKDVYQLYRQSIHWQLMRYNTWTKARGVCRLCKKPFNGSWVVHHKNTKAYEHLGKERNGIDVEALCPVCHNEEFHRQLHINIEIPEFAKKI